MEITYTMEYYKVIKKNEVMSIARKWMELEIIILTETSRSEKDKLCTFSLPLKMSNKGWAQVARACESSYLGGRDQNCCLRPARAKFKTLSQKYTTQKKRAGEVVQVVQYLSSIPSTREKNPLYN
jgi:hypothetical protein